jgi:hypothetical protein
VRFFWGEKSPFIATQTNACTQRQIISLGENYFVFSFFFSTTAIHKSQHSIPSRNVTNNNIWHRCDIFIFDFPATVSIGRSKYVFLKLAYSKREQSFQWQLAQICSTTKMEAGMQRP